MLVRHLNVPILAQSDPMRVVSDHLAREANRFYTGFMPVC